MNGDDWIYLFLLLISIPFAYLIRNIPNTSYRRILLTVIGFLMAIFVCGYDVYHVLLTTIVNCLIILNVSPKKCHWFSFVWCFSYIVFFRTTHFFGLPKVSPHANAVQLLLTLKLVGLAFEVHDTYTLEEEITQSNDQKLILRHSHSSIDPDILDMFAYSFCFIGMLTGPYYKYRTYNDMILNPKTQLIDFWPHIETHLKIIPIVAIFFLIISSIYSIEYAKSEEFLSRSIIYKLYYMVPMFMVFRSRFYTAWMISECVCVLANLGAYPVAAKSKCGSGPTDYQALDEVSENTQYNYETIHNVSIYDCEMSVTIRQCMKGWNMSVQYWLATYVYKRIKFRNPTIRVTITMLVSAFWHGVHPGYYLSFLLIPINLYAEDSMISAFRNTHRLNPKLFDIFCWFCKVRSLDYMCMGFLLLSWTDTINYWSSIYFCGHIFIFMFIAIGYFFSPNRTPVSH